MSNPVITIGVPVRNCEKTIGRTLRSIIDQNYPHDLLQLIVVDDGCADHTISNAIEELRNSKIGFRILNTGGKGLGPARQKVVENARGKYIVWVDGDATIPHDYIYKQVVFMESHDRVGKARGRWGRIRTGKIAGDLQYLAYSYTVRNGTESKITGIGCSICRTEAIRKAGGFDTKISGAGEDVDLAIRMLNCGWKFAVTDTLFYSQPRSSWGDLWGQSMWYGYGSHYLNHKYRRNSGLTLLPPIIIVQSIRETLASFKSTRDNVSFLLPLFLFFNSVAWWLGFIKAHFHKYLPNE